MASVSKAATVDYRNQVLLPNIALAGSIGALIWAHWNSLTQTAVWWNSPKYSHGWLIPLFTLGLLYMRRNGETAIGRLSQFGAALAGVGVATFAAVYFFLPGSTALNDPLASALICFGVAACVGGTLLYIHQPTAADVPLTDRMLGVGLLIGTMMLRLVVTYLGKVVPEMYTFVLAVLAIFLIVGGWGYLRWAGGGILCLFFMFPLLGELEGRVHRPLQSAAASTSTFCLQTLGIAASQEGNSIFIDDVHMKVEAQCSGLRMLTMFFFLAVAVTLVTDRPIWERIVLIASAAPIALLVNVARITITGVLYKMAISGMYVNLSQVEQLGHDMAGWFMMPVAIGLLYVEMQVLQHLFIEEGSGPVGMGMAMPGMRLER